MSNNSTLVPGSAVTSTGVLVPALPVRSVVIFGWVGLAGVAAVASFGLLASDVWPSFVALAVTLPAGISTVGVIVTLPLVSAVPSPIFLPSLSNNSTLVPGSAVTSTGVLVPAFPVRSVVTTGWLGLAGVAGFWVTNSDNGFVSVEPSVYVTTRFPALSFATDSILVLASLASTVLPFLPAKFASSLLLEYSSFSFFSILAKSSFVTLAGSATSTFSVGVAISYLDVWFLTTNRTYPGFSLALGSWSSAL